VWTQGGDKITAPPKTYPKKPKLEPRIAVSGKLTPRRRGSAACAHQGLAPEVIALQVQQIEGEDRELPLPTTAPWPLARQRRRGRHQCRAV
jgi:hypothetical protein